MREAAPAAERLPDDITERMRRLGDAAAGGTTPWPGVERAVRRGRRRAAANGVVALALGTAAITTALQDPGPGRSTVTPSDLPSPSPSESPSAAQPEPSPTPPGPYLDRRRPGAEVPPPPTGLGPTAGSLAGDEAWVAALRDTIATRNQADGPEQVHVLWAGRLDGQRYAATVAPDFDRAGGSGNMSWLLHAWQVSADGRDVAQSEFGATGMSLEPGQDVRTVSLAIDLIDVAGSSDIPDRSAVLVVDARARSVDIGGPSRYPAAGGKERTFVPLTREGLVWPGVLTRAQRLDGLLRITAADGTRRDGTSSRFSGYTTPPSFAAVAPAGADPDLVRCSGGGWLDALPAGAEPVLAGTTRSGGAGWSVGVLRAREGGYLLGTCRDGGSGPNSRFVVPAPAGGLDRLTALLPIDRTPDGRGRLFGVLAPADATTVELGGRPATVHERIAVIDLGEERSLDGLRVTARRADGGVAGTADVAIRDRELDLQFVDEGLPPE